MEKKDTALEVKNTPVRRPRKKSSAVLLKKRLNLLWLKLKSLFKGKKSKNKKTTKKKVQDAPLSKKITVIVLNLLGMAAVVFIVPYIALEWLDSYARHGEERKVPNVYGCELSVAKGMLAKNSLGYDIIEYRHREGVGQDVVLMMYPDSGSVVKEGRQIGLVLNTTEKPKKVVPSIIDNRTFREAESHIRAAGFIIERIDTVPGEKDWVYEVIYDGVSLSNGDAIPERAKITVVIGSGEELVEEEEPIYDSNFDI